MTISVNAEAPEAGVSRYTKWAIALFFAALFIPGSFYVGVRMTPYRFYLIVMAIPMVIRYRNDPTLRITMVDALVFLAVSWRSLALVVNHQGAELMNASSSFIELFFGYMLGRVFVRSAADYRFFFGCFLVTLAVFLPFALFELTSRQRILRQLWGVVLVQPPEEISGPQIRFGLMRVQVSFNHAIMFGMFCAMGFANVFYIYKFPRHIIYTGFVGLMTFMAISSSSILTIAIQGGLIVYEIILRPFRYKWGLLVIGSGAVWFSFELIMGKTIIDYIVTELVINQAGAEGRLDQMRYGILEVYRQPFFGLGVEPPALPFWRGDVFDNFWLQTAVRYGVPAAAFFAAAFLLHFLRAGFAGGLTEEEGRQRVGYLIALFTTILIVTSASPWGIGIVFLMVYFGIGAWFYDRPRGGARPGAPRPRPSGGAGGATGARARPAPAPRRARTPEAGPARRGAHHSASS